VALTVESFITRLSQDGGFATGEVIAANPHSLARLPARGVRGHTRFASGFDQDTSRPSSAALSPGNDVGGKVAKIATPAYGGNGATCRCGPRKPRSGSARPALGPGPGSPMSKRCWARDFHPDHGPSRRRRVSPARGRGPACGRFPAGKRSLAEPIAGRGAMNEVANRPFAAQCTTAVAPRQRSSGARHRRGSLSRTMPPPFSGNAGRRPLVLSPPRARPHPAHRSLPAALCPPRAVVAAITAADIPGKNDIAPIRKR